ATDVEVVTFCGEQGWGLITCDELRHTRETVRAIMRYHVAIFRVVLRKRTHGVRIMSALVQAQRAIIDTMAKHRGAFCAHVRADGTTRIMSRFDQAQTGLTEAQ